MTDKALKANKDNASKSTGPKTKRDMTTLQPNMKHGILAKIPVIPGIENQEEWDQFVVDIKMNLKPIGVLESTLVESLANYFWKKQRLIKYEQNRIHYKIEAIKDKANSMLTTYYENLYKKSEDYVDPDRSKLDELRSNVKDFSDSLKAFEKYTDWPDDKDMEGDDAGYIVACALELLYAVKKNNGEDVPDTPYDLFNVNEIVDDFWNPDKSATPKQVVEIIEKIGEKFGYDPSVLEYSTRKYVKDTHKALEKQVQVVDQSIDTLANEELYDNSYSEKVMKMDAQLNRTIMQTLHELQRLQGMRVGLAGPPEAVDITGIDL